jgi:predicted transcriptional regulator
MSRWFRLYDELLDDPKVQRLPPADFKGWINLLCLASRNDGKLPPTDDIAFALRETEDAVSTLLERLLNGGLIERRSGGADGMHYAPYKWGERQYKSDTSTDRVKRFRQRSKEVSETAPETETETDTEEKPTTSVVGKKTDPRGTRLAEDWEPKPFSGKTAEMVAAWPVGMLERELSKFRDYFLKTPGVRGRSLDWDASLRNWLRTADERKPRLIHERDDRDPTTVALSRLLGPHAGTG